MTDITVAICTWNRSDIVRGTLTKISRLDVPEGVTWEVLVVDNHSTDDTRATIEAFEHSLPLRYHMEPKQGIACARNAVLKHANGSLIVWLDDDCRPHPNHLCRYWHAAMQWPDAILFSGGIEPDFEEPPPSWIAENLDVLAPVYGRLMRVGDSRALHQYESVFSGNMATRSSVRQYTFDESLGRSNGGRLGGEEIDLFRRIQNAGHQAIWVEGVVVQHFISQATINERYVFDSFHAEGRLRVKLYGQRPAATLFGYPRWALRRWVQASAAQSLLRWNRGRRWLIAFRNAAEMGGLLRQWKVPSN